MTYLLQPLPVIDRSFIKQKYYSYFKLNWDGCREILIKVQTPTVVHIESWSELRFATLIAFIATPTAARVPITAPITPRSCFENSSMRYNSTCKIDTNYIILWNKNNIYLTPPSGPNISVNPYPCFSVISFAAIAFGNSSSAVCWFA